MKAKILRVWAFLTLLLIALLALSVLRSQSLKADNERLSANQKALLTGLKTYKTKDSLNAARSTVVRLNKKEAKHLIKPVLRRAKNAGVKHVETAASVVTSTEIKLKGTVVDSVLTQNTDSPTLADTAKCIKAHNDYAIIDVCITKTGMFSGTVQVKDSLELYVEIVKKRFLFIKYGVKRLDVIAVSRNKSTFIKGLTVYRLDGKRW